MANGRMVDVRSTFNAMLLYTIADGNAIRDAVLVSVRNALDDTRPHRCSTQPDRGSPTGGRVQRHHDVVVKFVLGLAEGL